MARNRSSWFNCAHSTSPPSPPSQNVTQYSLGEGEGGGGRGGGGDQSLTPSQIFMGGPWDRGRSGVPFHLKGKAGAGRGRTGWRSMLGWANFSRYPSLAVCPQAQMVRFSCWVMCLALTGTGVSCCRRTDFILLRVEKKKHKNRGCFIGTKIILSGRMVALSLIGSLVSTCLSFCLTVSVVLPFLFDLVKDGDLLLLIENSSSQGSGHGSD